MGITNNRTTRPLHLKMVVKHGKVAILLMSIFKSDASLLRTSNLSTKLGEYGACSTIVFYDSSTDCSGDAYYSETYSDFAEGDECYGFFGTHYSDFCSADGYKFVKYDNDTCDGEGNVLNTFEYGCTAVGKTSFSVSCVLEPCPEGSTGGEGNELVEAFKKKHMMKGVDMAKVAKMV